MKRFNFTFDDSKNAADYNNRLPGDVLDFFNAIDWSASLQEYNKAVDKSDYISYFYTVEYKDEFNLESSFDVELYMEDQRIQQGNLPLKFSLTYSYQESQTKKLFFGIVW